MKKVIYMGDNEKLQGETALSQETDSKFTVQFDNLSLSESHGWHEYNKKDFMSIKDLKEQRDLITFIDQIYNHV